MNTPKEALGGQQDDSRPASPEDTGEEVEHTLQEIIEIGENGVVTRLDTAHDIDAALAAAQSLHEAGMLYLGIHGGAEHIQGQLERAARIIQREYTQND